MNISSEDIPNTENIIVCQCTCGAEVTGTTETETIATDGTNMECSGACAGACAGETVSSVNTEILSASIHSLNVGTFGVSILVVLIAFCLFIMTLMRAIISDNKIEKTVWVFTTFVIFYIGMRLLELTTMWGKTIF